MVTLSLHSSELVHVLRARRRLDRMAFDHAILSGTPIMVSAVVVHELHAGALASAWPMKRLSQVQELLTSVTEMPLTPHEAEVSGRLSAELRLRGRSIGDIDTLIAGQAIA